MSRAGSTRSSTAPPLRGIESGVGAHLHVSGLSVSPCPASPQARPWPAAGVKREHFWRRTPYAAHRSPPGDTRTQNRHPASRSTTSPTPSPIVTVAQRECQRVRPGSARTPPSECQPIRSEHAPSAPIRPDQASVDDGGRRVGPRWTHHSRLNPLPRPPESVESTTVEIVSQFLPLDSVDLRLDHSRRSV